MQLDGGWWPGAPIHLGDFPTPAVLLSTADSVSVPHPRDKVMICKH